MGYEKPVCLLLYFSIFNVMSSGFTLYVLQAKIKPFTKRTNNKLSI